MPSETETNRSALLRSLPSVNRLLSDGRLSVLGEHYSLSEVKCAARAVLDDVREQVLARRNGVGTPSMVAAATAEELVCRVISRVQSESAPTLQAAVNATGIVLHTGLGRSRLSTAAIAAVTEVARGHSLLEIGAETGKRGSRQDHVNNLLCELTGAESAAVVNNCAGAVLLVVTAIASGKEVILSRGEMVEIGGAFRMPEIIEACGARLAEVGATNRTRISDYRKAITAETGLILRCHPSNFAILGFTQEAESSELAALGREHGIPVMEDQGSGAILDPVSLGLSLRHGSLPRSVKAGFDLVTASGDKLLGGTQAGIILGRRDLIETVMSHPLARALRVDKLTLAGLEATLRLYRDPAQAMAAIPTLRYLTRTGAEIRRMAVRLRSRLMKAMPAARFEISLLAEKSHAGGGSLPTDELSTTCVAIRTLTACDSAEGVAKRFREANPPIFGRIKDDAFLLDPRTLEDYEIVLIGKVVWDA